MLDGDNKYRCEHTKRLVRATKQFTIERAPRVLSVLLKRFEFGAFGGKIDRHVAFPVDLDVGPYMSAKCVFRFCLSADTRTQLPHARASLSSPLSLSFCVVLRLPLRLPFPQAPRRVVPLPPLRRARAHGPQHAQRALLRVRARTQRHVARARPRPGPTSAAWPPLFCCRRALSRLLFAYRPPFLPVVCPTPTPAGTTSTTRRCGP